MVDGESAVLPAPAAFDLDDLAASLLDEPELDETEPSVSRSSRPFTDKDWMDQDHYFDGDLPADQHGSAEWKETYKDMDEIQVNYLLPFRERQLVVRSRRQHRRGNDCLARERRRDRPPSARAVAHVDRGGDWRRKHTVQH